MKRPQLTAEARTVLGKKVKKLRREGLLPCNVYGKGLKSHALQVKTTDFEKVYKEAGETGVIDLNFDGKAKPVLIKNMQMNYDSNTPLHVDFYQVNLKEKVKTLVPIVLVGEPKAVTEKVGILLQTLSDVEVEALPDKLPENVEASVEHLAELGEQMTVADLKTAEDVTILTDPSQTVAKINELAAEEPEPEPEESEEGAEEGKENETAEGETKERGEELGEKNNEENSEEKTSDGEKTE